MTVKVVDGGEMFFKDDIQIIDVELGSPLSIPVPLPIIDKDELQIFYKGQIYLLTEEKGKEAIPDALFKAYTCNFGLREIATAKEHEVDYFTRNKKHFDQQKSDFIERTVNGIDVLDDELKGTLGPQISSELVERITQEYASLISSSTAAASVFESFTTDRLLVRDGRVYSLLTIPEYIERFENGIRPSFYKKLLPFSVSATPEEIYKKITENENNVRRNAFPMLRNKIWHSQRSSKFLLDDIYWIPQYEGGLDELHKKYKKLLGRKVKIDAAKEYA